MNKFAEIIKDHKTTKYYINEEHTFIIEEEILKPISQTTPSTIRNQIYLLKEWQP